MGGGAEAVYIPRHVIFILLPSTAPRRVRGRMREEVEEEKDNDGTRSVVVPVR